ncbi:hypothetical protein GVN24_31450, partial [Rhizobium sp. CRIBSB]|nr:hypothetical protein [Rhizobium sp. CRIBSB]
IAAEAPPYAPSARAVGVARPAAAPIRPGTVLTAPALPEPVTPPEAEPVPEEAPRQRIDPRTWRLQRTPAR